MISMNSSRAGTGLFRIGGFSAGILARGCSGAARMLGSAGYTGILWGGLAGIGL